MRNRLQLSCALLWLAAAASWGASVERADQLYLAGDLDGARAELHELLAGADGESDRAPALALLGRLEVERRDWRAALDAWGELTDRYALSPHAEAVSAAIRPLQALVGCACAGADAPLPAPAAATTPATATTPAAPAAAAEPIEPIEPQAAPVPEAAPPPARAPADPGPAAGLLLVGGWGAEYEASQEVTRDLVEFFAANGVGVRAASTEVPAVRGEDAVLSYLLEEARRTGADGVIFVTTRFDFREFIQIERYDAGGAKLWRDRLAGGTALKERRDRGRPSWGLVDRIKKKLAERLGTPDLPTG